MQRTYSLLAFRAAKLIGSGVYDEDHVNDYTTKMINHNSRMKTFYGRNEFNTSIRITNVQELVDSKAQHEGRDPVTGHSAFEREMERKGIAVDKYPLPNSVQATRVREMTLLRRMKLEEQSAEAMAAKRSVSDVPSAWYDESKGPLNPHYLKFVKPQYTKMDVTDLPTTPLSYASIAAKK